jgi:hypothetical protein
MATIARPLWIAYAADGRVVGTIRGNDDGYLVTIAGASSSVGTYPTMEIAKNALHTHLRPGSDWPTYRQH